MSPRAYVLSFLALTAAGFVLIAALGLAVDGYGIFGTRLISEARFPSNERLLKHGDRITKAIEIAQRQGDRILILGDSRTQHGIDPDAPALDGVKGYNAALAAATLAEQLVALDYTLAHEPSIKRIVWGLSFEAFPYPIPTQTDFADSAFAGHSIAHGLLRHLFAFDRALASWKALLQARHKVRAPMKRNGVVTYSGDPVQGPLVAKYFEGELAGTARNLQGPMSTEEIAKAEASFSAKLRELKAKGIDVDLVIVPVHVWRLEFLRLIDVEPQSDAWKRWLASTVATLSNAPGTGQTRIFDFARPHPFVEQPVYSPLPAGERRYYLETSHFYPWLGDKILAKVFGKVDEEDDSPPFGCQIDASNVERDIATADAELGGWEATHPADVAKVKQLIGK
jgi:hypothetical protein